MTLRRFTFAMLFGLLVPSAAHAGIETSTDISTASTASCSASRERVPSPASTLVPTVIVLAAIGATVARMNRRGGPR